MANYSEERLNQIWDKGQTINKPSYGKTSAMGWNVDHSKPQALGGTDHLNNLQPMNSRENSSKGKKYPK